MTLQQRQDLLTRAQRLAQTLYPSANPDGSPVSLVFAGYAQPVPAARMSAASTSTLMAGGLAPSAPTTFFILKADLAAAGIPLSALVAKKTLFSEGATTYKVEQIDSEPAEPQIKLGCNLARR